MLVRGVGRLRCADHEEVGDVGLVVACVCVALYFHFGYGLWIYLSISLLLFCGDLWMLDLNL